MCVREKARVCVCVRERDHFGLLVVERLQDAAGVVDARPLWFGHLVQD